MRFLPLALRACSALLLGGILTFWMLNGAHRGWNMDRVPVEKTDELTGIAYVEYEDRFVPGMEFLGAGVAASAVLFGLSFLFRKRVSNLRPSS
jgi:hypothetical protein